MNPDELLMQIQELLGEYLAMGEDTPVAAEAQALAAAIDATAGGGAEEGAAGELGGLPAAPLEEEGPAAMGAPVAPEGEMPPEEEGGGMPPPPSDMGPGDALATMMPSSPPKGFGDASSMALEDMKKRKGKGY